MHRLIASALLTALLTACATNAPPQMPPSAPSVDRRAGTWRPWVLASGQELRLPAPPDASATAAEMDQLRALVTQRTPAMQERIRYWDFWSPSHTWNETLIDISAANPIPGGAAMRMFAMLNVAMNDAMIAAWDTKYTYNRPRPAEFDTRFRSAFCHAPQPLLSLRAFGRCWSRCDRHCAHLPEGSAADECCRGGGGSFTGDGWSRFPERYQGRSRAGTRCSRSGHRADEGRWQQVVRHRTNRTWSVEGHQSGRSR